MLSLKQIRVGADLTIEDACKLCECSAPTFAKWEKEPGKMGIKAFSRLIEYAKGLFTRYKLLLDQYCSRSIGLF